MMVYRLGLLPICRLTCLPTPLSSPSFTLVHDLTLVFSSFMLTPLSPTRRIITPCHTGLTYRF